MGQLKWYKRDPDAALTGFFELTLEERGAYGTVLDLIYARDGNLPDDDKFIAGFLRSDVRVWRRIKKVLLARGKITIEDGIIRNFRATSEILTALSRIGSASDAGVASGISRRRKSEAKLNKNNALIGTGVPTEHQRTLELTTTTTTTTTREKKEDDLKVVQERKPPDWQSRFDEWWSSVPKKVGKGQARIKFKAALKKTDFDTLKAGIMRYAGQVAGRDVEFIAHPATWLHGERWLDEDEPERKTHGNEHRGNGTGTGRRSPHATLLAAGAWAARGSDSGMPGPAAAAPEGAEPDGGGTEGSGGRAPGLPRPP